MGPFGENKVIVIHALIRARHDSHQTFWFKIDWLSDTSNQNNVGYIYIDRDILVTARSEKHIHTIEFLVH